MKAWPIDLQEEHMMQMAGAVRKLVCLYVSIAIVCGGK